jgi:hypothetical protein
MGSRNPSRSRLWGADADPLGSYERDYTLTAVCRCGHERELPVALLLRVFGPEASLRQMRERLRCHRCGKRGATLKVCFAGRRGDGT